MRFFCGTIFQKHLSYHHSGKLCLIYNFISRISTTICFKSTTVCLFSNVLLVMCIKYMLDCSHGPCLKVSIAFSAIKTWFIVGRKQKTLPPDVSGEPAAGTAVDNADQQVALVTDSVNVSITSGSKDDRPVRF